MDKKEYLKRLNDLHHQEMQIRKKKRELDNEYMNSSPMNKFKYGEKVVVKIKRGKTYDIDYAFVMGYTINNSSADVELELVRCKKDGTPSKIRLYYLPQCGDKIVSMNDFKEEQHAG